MHNTIKSRLLTETTTSWDGTPLPPYPDRQPQVTIKEFIFSPHCTTEWHSHDVINTGYVLEGELTIVCRDGLERTFRAAEPIVECVGTIHRGENRTDTPTRIVMFYAAAPDLPLSKPL